MLHLTSATTPARLLAAVTTLVLALALTACSGDDETPPSPGAGSETSTATPEERTLPEGLQQSVVKISNVSGSLSKRHRKRLVAEVGGVVDRWFERAWLAAPLGPKARPFPGFTPAAAKRARAQRFMTTARGIEVPVGGVVPRTRGIRLDVLAPGGTPKAVTARFHLGLTPYDRELERIGSRRVVVTGRLMLAQVGKRWRVFGYDVSTSLPGETGKQKATKQKATKQKAGKKKAKRNRKGARR